MTDLKAPTAGTEAFESTTSQPGLVPPAIAPVQPIAQPPPPRAAALRVTALGRKAAKWATEIVEVDGEHYLVRAPSVAAQKKIMAVMPDQKFSGKQGEDDTIEAGELDVTVRPEIMFDMKIERVIQCTHDLHGQRIFGDEDRAELEKLAADDELLDKVNAAVDRLTKKAVVAGKKA